MQLALEQWMGTNVGLASSVTAASSNPKPTKCENNHSQMCRCLHLFYSRLLLNPAESLFQVEALVQFVADDSELLNVLNSFF